MCKVRPPSEDNHPTSDQQHEASFDESRGVLGFDTMGTPQVHVAGASNDYLPPLPERYLGRLSGPVESVHMLHLILRFPVRAR